MYFRDHIYFLNTVVSAGFPSPAEDIFASKLSLQDYLIKNPNTTICIKVSGDSMKNIGIFSGDILIVDKSINPRNNHIVLCTLDGQFLVKKLSITKNSIKLISENKNYPLVNINEYDDFKIFGVVTASVKKFL
jgi:DNA polymerase V